MELRAPLLENLRSDPFERAEYEGMDYQQWYIDRMFLMAPAAGLRRTMVAKLPRISAASETRKLQPRSGDGIDHQWRPTNQQLILCDAAQKTGCTRLKRSTTRTTNPHHSNWAARKIHPTTPAASFKPQTGELMNPTEIQVLPLPLCQPGACVHKRDDVRIGKHGAFRPASSRGA